MYCYVSVHFNISENIKLRIKKVHTVLTEKYFLRNNT